MSLKNDSKKKTTAAKRAEEIRSRATADAKIAPFTVINGDGDDWFYYHVPDGEQKARLEEKLTRLGYESAPGVKMAGIFGGSVWRIPKEIKEDHLKQRKQRLKDREF